MEKTTFYLNIESEEPVPINIKGINLEATSIDCLLSAELTRMNDLWIAVCPQLSTVSQGNSKEQALDNLSKACWIFLMG